VSDLKPCPFCGTEPTLFGSDMLQCEGCGATGPYTKDELRGADPAVRWNRRVLDPAVREKLEKVERALRQNATAGFAKAGQPEANHVVALDFIAADSEAQADAIREAIGE
jgi:hypothetical protein